LNGIGLPFLPIIMSTDYYGLPTRRIRNQHLSLDFLSEAGPRIVRLMLGQSDQNLLAEVPDISWSNQFGEFFLRGGHRLTHAPESPRSYVPDGAGLIVEDLSHGVRLQTLEAATNIRKSMDIGLSPDQPQVTLHHRLQNDGGDPIELAPWSITQMRLGGLVVMPICTATDGLLPDRHIVVWPYTRWHDARLRVEDDSVFVTAQPDMPPLKVGSLNRGWLGYLIGDVFFTKRFDPLLDQLHPDRNCNVEVYCNDRFVELETLAPLIRLKPGETIEHVETWELHRVEGAAPTPDGVRRLLQSIEL
jgi:hypothetical protein